MLSVILVLYKTPLSKLDNLKNYKKFNLLIFEQEGSRVKEKKLKKKLGFNFKYFFSEKNIGLPKAVNFLVKKVKTKYCLMTEPDIIISSNNILGLKKIIKKNNNIIITGPKYTLKKNFLKKKINFSYKLKKFIDPSCVIFNVRLIQKIKFYDENFYYYWEDIDLMQRINKTKYHLAEAQNIFAVHETSTSSEPGVKTFLIKNINFKYGELLLDYKNRKIKFVKIFRQFFQSIFFSFVLIFFSQKFFIRYFGYFIGINKFLFFYIKQFILNLKY